MTNELSDYLYKKNRNYVQLKAEVPLNEAIRRIESCRARYDPNIEGYDAWDQMMASEGNRVCAPLAQVHTSSADHETNTNDSESVNGMYSVARKQQVNTWLTDNKRQIINKINTCNYITSRFELANLLTELFVEWPSEPTHFLYISQNWNPLAISRCLSQMVKETDTGIKTYKSPPAYLTLLLKYRKKRKNR